MYLFVLLGLELELLHDEIANALARLVLSKPKMGSSGEQDQASSSAIQRAILRSLSYPDMKVREEHVPVPYAGTREWIFQETGWPSLESIPRWLNDKNADMDIFWITGKAGCGECLEDVIGILQDLLSTGNFHNLLS